MVFAPAQSTSCTLRPREVQALTRSQACKPEEREEPDFPPLSQRELDVLRLIAKGFSNAMVGVELGITDQTVKNHVSSILEKFDVFDRTSAVVKALLCKLISLNEFDLNDIVTREDVHVTQLRPILQITFSSWRIAYDPSLPCQAVGTSGPFPMVSRSAVFPHVCPIFRRFVYAVSCSACSLMQIHV